MLELSAISPNSAFTDLNSSEMTDVDGGVLPVIFGGICLMSGALLGKVALISAGAGVLGLGIWAISR